MAKDNKPFTDGHWDLALEGTCKGAKWPPKAAFKKGQKPGTVLFSMQCAHEEMAEGRKSWSQSMNFKDFLRIINVLRYIALDTSDDEIMKEYKFRFFKDGKMNLTGTSVIMGRAANGCCYLSFRAKQIPKVGFWFRSDNGKLLACNKDGQNEDIREDSRITLLSEIEHWIARYHEWSAKDIVEEEPYNPNGGGNGNSSGSYNNSSSGGGSDDDVNFDDDVPF